MPNRYMDLPGQEPISETYQNIEAGFDAVQDDVDTASGVSEGIQAEVTEHKDSAAAHAAEHITYSGPVAGAGNMKAAVDSVQQQLDEAVISGDSSVEAAQARVSSTGETYTTLKQRLDDEHDTVSAQLAEKAMKSEVVEALALKAEQVDLDRTAATVSSNYSTLDTKINSQASGSPKGVYPTLVDLQNAFPTGNSNTYVTTSDGKWYYWSNNAWTAGGVYQSTGIADNSVTIENISNDKQYWNIFLTKYFHNTGYGVTDVGLFFKTSSVNPSVGSVINVKANIQVDKDVTLGAGKDIKMFVKTATSLVEATGKVSVGTTMVKNKIYTLNSSFTYTDSPGLLEFLFISSIAGNYTEPLNFLVGDVQLTVNGTSYDTVFSGYQYNGSLNTPARDTNLLYPEYYYGSRHDSFATRRELSIEVASNEAKLAVLSNPKLYWNIFLSQYRYYADFNATDVGTFFKTASHNIIPTIGDAVNVKATIQIDKDVPLGAGKNIKTFIKTETKLIEMTGIRSVGNIMTKDTPYVISSSYTFVDNPGLLEIMFIVDFYGNYTEPVVLTITDLEVKLNNVPHEMVYSGYQYNGALTTPARDTNVLINTNYYFGRKYNTNTTRRELHDAIMPYATKEELQSYALQTDLDDIPSTYATKAELALLDITSAFSAARIVCFGDSITEGDYGWEPGLDFNYGLPNPETNTHPNFKEKNYPYFLNQYLTPASIENKGLSGAQSSGMWSSKVSSYDFTNVDIVIFMIGINGGLEGNITTDLVLTSGQTYLDYANTGLGYYAKCIAKAITDNPNLQVFLVQTPKTPNTSDGRNDALKQRAYDVPKQLGNYFSIPVIDAYNLSGISPLTYGRYLNATDKLHPNEEGYRALAETIGNGLKQHYRV